MTFTGERLVPEEAEPQLLAEHLARYRFASDALGPGRVLDLGCGLGYGRALLESGGERCIVGADISAGAIALAATRHPGAYVVCDARALPFRDRSFEHLVALELLEHLERPQALVEETRRVLGERGSAVFSTPNRTTYVDESGHPPNPFHVRELYRGEIESLLRSRFPQVRLFGEAVVEAVAIVDLEGGLARPELALFDGAPRPPLAVHPEPDYFLAVCRCAAGDAGAWPAGRVSLGPLETLRRLRRQHAETERDLDEKRGWALRLRDELAERDVELRRVQRQLDAARARALGFEAELLRRRRRRETGAGEDSGAARPPRTLVVGAAPADVLARLRPLIEDHLAAGPVTYLVTERQGDTLGWLREGGADLVVSGSAPRSLLRTTAGLRRRRFTQTILVSTDHTGFRRLKVAGLAAGWPAPLVVDGDGDVFLGTFAAIVRHLRGRASRARQRGGHQLRSAGRLLRSSGWRATLRRAGERLGWPAARRRLRQRLAGLPRPRWPLHFTPAAAPLVSIIVPVRDRWALTYRCFHALHAHSRDVPCELLLVDDGSRDGTRRAERTLRGVRVLRQENAGFVDACLRGAQAARGRFLLFLNNDVLVTPGWLPALLATFDNRPNCGAAGAKLVFPDGRLQEAGGIVWRDGSAWNYGRDDDPEAAAYGYCREVDYCSAAALLVRRSAWDKVGGFDRRFAPGYWEDADLGFALREAGFQVWYQPACVLEHAEGASAGTDERRGMKRFQAAHRATFREKWAARLEAQVPFDSRRLFTARDRNRDPLVMVFDHYVPMADRDAGSLVMDEMLATLVEDGYRVVFWPDNRYRMPAYCDRQQQRGIEVVYGAVDLEPYLEQMGRRIAVAIAFRARIAERYLPQVLPFADALGYVAADLEHLRESRRCGVLGGAAVEVEALRAREAAVVALADAVAVFSPVERALLEREFRPGGVFELPLPAPPLLPPAGRLERRRDLLFVGSTHPPNVDALIHFASAVLPRVRQSLGPVTLRVVGQVCEAVPELRRLPGVELVGTVASLDGLFAEARVFVAPLRYGAGVKGKIVAALAGGLPVVTTSVGAEGLALVDGDSVLVADGEEAFATAVVRLCADDALWLRLSAAGRAVASGRHSPAHFRSAFREFLRELLRGGESGARRERRSAGEP